MEYPIIIILVALIQYLLFGLRTGIARGKFGIDAPRVTGNETWERYNRVHLNTLEQLIVDNVRKREAETQLMNAHLYQWRYGQRYGSEMFSNTAQKLDGWRQP